jgi:ligand-binding sensor domain-containing protein/signal transduction histidine kinase
LRSFNIFRNRRAQRFALFRLLAAALLAAGSAPTAHAIDPNRTMSQYVRQEWGIDSGFPRGPVYAINQTADGYLWIGTASGLVRFDGLNFTRIQSLIPKLPAMSGVLGLETDDRGDLWVRPPRPMMLRYRDGKFEDARKDPRLFNATALLMSRSRNGALLIWGTAGCSVLRGGKAHLVPIPRDFTPSPVLSVAQTDDGDIWVGTRDAGLFRLSGGKSTQVTSGLPDLKVNSLAPAPGNQLWVATDGGIAKWDGAKLSRDGIPKALEGVQALAMTLDRDSNLWIGTNSLGLVRLNHRGVAFLEDPHQVKNAVTAVFEDREGDVWAGSASSLQRLRDSAFITYSLPEGLPTDGANPVYVDSGNRMWFPPVDGGLWWMKDGQHGQVTLDGLDKDIVYSIAGRSGELWLGRQHGGLTHLHAGKVGFAARTYTHADGLVENSVYSVYEGRDGSVWAGTLSGGVSKLTAGRFTTYSTADGLASNAVTSILESSGGTMWFATPTGLSALSGAHWKTYRVADGLPSDDILCLLEDSTGVVWIGTNAGIAFRDSTGIHVPGRVPDALGEQILGMAEDALGSLWVSTSNHVVRVNRAKLLGGALAEGDLRDYGLADGLRGVEGVKRQRSVIEDPLGRIWFSLNRGISVVDPARLGNNSAPAIAHVEGISADGAQIGVAQIGESGAVYTPGVQGAVHIPGVQGAIHIPGGHRRITFAYSGVSLSVPERVRFRYKLEGYDRDWSDPVSNHDAPYTNLPPRAYRFRVIASNPDGAWIGKEAAVAFNVEPLFWQTWTFDFAVAAACGLAIFVFYRFRLRQMASRLNLRFEERLGERTRIAQELHDTLLQGFLSASMQVHVAAACLPADSAAKPTLTRALQLMGQVIDEGRNAIRGLRSSQSPSLDLEQAFLGIREEQVSAGARNGAADFRIIVDGERRALSPPMRDELYRIGREAALNAFRHSQARQIEIELQYSPSRLRMLVRDNGCGFEPEVIASALPGHWGLIGMRERAERIGARLQVFSSGAGTEVELSVPGHIAFQGQSHYKSNRFGKWRRRFRG